VFFKKEGNQSSEGRSTQQIPVDSGEHLSHNIGEKTNHSGMYDLEIEVSIMIIDIYLLTCTYKVSSFNGRACNS
jgi:hypothetical protein